MRGWEFSSAVECLLDLGLGPQFFFFFWGGEVEHRVLRKGKIGAGGDGGGGDRGEYLMFVSVPKEQKFSQF